jgi:hypothetical protein
MARCIDVRLYMPRAISKYARGPFGPVRTLSYTSETGTGAEVRPSVGGPGERPCQH